MPLESVDQCDNYAYIVEMQTSSGNRKSYRIRIGQNDSRYSRVYNFITFQLMKRCVCVCVFRFLTGPVWSSITNRPFNSTQEHVGGKTQHVTDSLRKTFSTLYGPVRNKRVSIQLVLIQEHVRDVPTDVTPGTRHYPAFTIKEVSFSVFLQAVKVKNDHYATL